MITNAVRRWLAGERGWWFLTVVMTVRLVGYDAATQSWLLLAVDSVLMLFAIGSLAHASTRRRAD